MESIRTFILLSVLCPHFGAVPINFLDSLRDADEKREDFLARKKAEVKTAVTVSFATLVPTLPGIEGR